MRRGGCGYLGHGTELFTFSSLPSTYNTDINIFACSWNDASLALQWTHDVREELSCKTTVDMEREGPLDCPAAGQSGQNKSGAMSSP